MPFKTAKVIKAAREYVKTPTKSKAKTLHHAVTHVQTHHKPSNKTTSTPPIQENPLIPKSTRTAITKIEQTQKPPSTPPRPTTTTVKPETTELLPPSVRKGIKQIDTGQPPPVSFTTGMNLELQKTQMINKLNKQLSSINPSAQYQLENGQIVSGSELRKQISGNIRTLITQKSYYPGSTFAVSGGQLLELPPEAQYLVQHSSIPPSEAVNLIKTGRASKLYESLPDKNKKEFGILFHPFTSEPPETWQYYPGGREYIEKHRDKIINDYIKQHGGYNKIVSSLSHGQYNELLELKDYLESKGIISRHMPSFKIDWSKGDYAKVVKLYVEDLLTRPEEKRKELYFSRLPLWQRLAQSGGYATISTLAFPVTISEYGIRTITGSKEVPVLTPVTRELHSIRPGGPSGLISTATEEGISYLTGQESNAWERFTRHPLSGIAATAGEITGMYGLSKAGEYTTKPFIKLTKSSIRRLPNIYNKLSSEFGKPVIVEKYGNYYIIKKLNVPKIVRKASQSSPARGAYKWSKGFRKAKKLISEGKRVKSEKPTPEISYYYSTKKYGGLGKSETLWLTPEEYKSMTSKLERMQKPEFSVAQPHGNIPYSFYYKRLKIKPRKAIQKEYSYFEYQPEPPVKVIQRNITPISNKPKLPSGYSPEEYRLAYAGELTYEGQSLSPIYNVIEKESVSPYPTGRFRPTKIEAWESLANQPKLEINKTMLESSLMPEETLPTTMKLETPQPLIRVQPKFTYTKDVFKPQAEYASKLWKQQYIRKYPLEYMKKQLKRFAKEETEAQQTLLPPEPRTTFKLSKPYFKPKIKPKPTHIITPYTPSYIYMTSAVASTVPKVAVKPKTVTITSKTNIPITTPVISYKSNIKPATTYIPVSTTATKPAHISGERHMTVPTSTTSIATATAQTQQQLQHQEQLQEQATAQRITTMTTPAYTPYYATTPLMMQKTPGTPKYTPIIPPEYSTTPHFGWKPLKLKKRGYFERQYKVPELYKLKKPSWFKKTFKFTIPKNMRLSYGNKTK